MIKQSQNDSFLLFSSPWQRLSFFRGLPVPLIHNLLQSARLTSTKPKEILYRQGEPAEEFGFVVEGHIRLFRKNSKGHRTVMDFVGPGGMVAGLLMASPTHYPVTIQFIGPGQFLRIPKSTYSKFWIQNPEVVQRTQAANLERMLAIQSTRELQKFSLEEKLAQILLRLSPSTEKNLHLNISRTDLADMIGASVASVIRVFSAWEKRGLIQVMEQGREQIDRQKLNELLEAQTPVHDNGVSHALGAVRPQRK